MRRKWQYVIVCPEWVSAPFETKTSAANAVTLIEDAGACHHPHSIVRRLAKDR
jgi:hypothetical protein